MPDLEAGMIAEPAAEVAEQPVDTALEQNLDTGIDEQPQNDGALEQPEAEQPAGDGRTLPNWLKAQIQALQANPATKGQAAQLRATWFGLDAYKKVFPTVKDAQQAREFYETSGGQEAFESLRAQIDESNGEIEAFRNGSPQFISDLADAEPEAFAKAMPAALDKFATMDPEMYQHIGARIVSNTLNESGFPNALEMLGYLVKTNPEEAVNRIKQFQGWLTGINNLANKAPQRSIDPERQKLDQERQQIEQQKTQMFRDSISRDILTHQTSTIRSLAETYFKHKLDDADFREFHNSVVARNNAEIKNDPAFLKRVQAHMDRGDRDAVLKAQKEKLAAILPKTVKAAYEYFTRLGGGKAAEQQRRVATNAARPDLGKGAGGGIKQSGPPNPKDIDRSKTTNDDILGGKAVLKNGTTYKW